MKLSRYEIIAQEMIDDCKADFGDNIGSEYICEMVRNIVSSEGWNILEEAEFWKAVTALGY